jgi:hypothetical protein
MGFAFYRVATSATAGGTRAEPICKWKTMNGLGHLPRERNDMKRCAERQFIADTVKAICIRDGLTNLSLLFNLIWLRLERRRLDPTSFYCKRFSPWKAVQLNTLPQSRLCCFRGSLKRTDNTGETGRVSRKRTVSPCIKKVQNPNHVEFPSLTRDPGTRYRDSQGVGCLQARRGL